MSAGYAAPPCAAAAAAAAAGADLETTSRHVLRCDDTADAAPREVNSWR